MSDSVDDKRLDRIEEKIDKLAEAMVSLARTEEKILAMEQNHRNQYDRMNKFSAKLDNIDHKVNENAHTVKIIGNVAYITSAALLGAIVKFLWF